MENVNEQRPETTPAKQDNNPVKEFFAAPGVKAKFEELLGARASGFLTSLLQVVAGNSKLKECNGMSIFNAAATAATMDLPINQNLGFAWIIPYKGQAQFQMGYKGFIQLAMRSGQYSRLNVVEVYENQFKSWNQLTEELDADFSKEPDGAIKGYVAYFRLINGFEKAVYWPIAKIEAHARKFSKNYEGKDSLWKTDFDSMAKKTVLKNLLNKWGILSIEMQLAVKVDQGIVKDTEGTVVYPDNEFEEEGDNRAEKAMNETANLMKEVKPTNKPQ